MTIRELISLTQRTFQDISNERGTAFLENDSLMSISFPSTLWKIESRAFKCCRSLRRVSIFRTTEYMEDTFPAKLTPRVHD